VVEYRQQAIGIEKPWQVANQLLVAAAEEEVVQDLAGAWAEHRICAACPVCMANDPCIQA
jgi:hypothetical protein